MNFFQNIENFFFNLEAVTGKILYFFETLQVFW